MVQRYPTTQYEYIKRVLFGHAARYDEIGNISLIHMIALNPLNWFNAKSIKLRFLIMCQL